MWEAIARNRRRSRLLILVMGLLLIAMGGAMGLYLDQQVGLPLGILAALVIWLFMLLTALYGGDSLLLSSAGATEITDKQQAPQLFNVVEEMAIAAGLAKVPRIFIIDETSPNAFAVGRNPDVASVAVTSGLLKRLDRDELQGVIAHEIGHVANLDIRFMTIAGVMVGAAALLSEVALRSLRFGAAGGARRSRNDNGGGGHPVMLLVILLFAILAPIAIRLLYLACSREREYLADASAARYTRYPQGLARALDKIAGQAAGYKPKTEIVAPMFIINPLQARGLGGMGLFSTHPPTEKRIAILTAMGGGAGFLEYEAAYEKVMGRKGLGNRTLETATPLPAREGDPGAGRGGEPRDQAIGRLREINDAIGLATGMIFLTCPCGVRIKVPGDYKGDKIGCVHCGRQLPLPAAAVAATLAGAAAAGAGQGGRKPPPVSPLGEVPGRGRAAVPPPLEGAEQVYRRRQAGWETFRCQCGAVQQLSPQFQTARTACRKCGRTIRIEASAADTA